MVDRVDKETRSYIMSRIRSKWTAPEKTVHNHLKGMKVRHQMHPKIDGSPDVILKDEKVAIFVHGCFWHKCPRCYREPQSNREYWLPKIERNVKRDRKNARKLRSGGWKVVRLWEHEILKNAKNSTEKIQNVPKGSKAF